MRRTKRRRSLKKRMQARKRLAEMPSMNTKPERQTMRILDYLGIKYVQQHGLCGYYFDLFLPAQNILVEINGGYFHASPLKYERSEWNRMQIRNHRRDNRKLNAAIARGYRVLYVWEDDLAHRSRTVRKQLFDAVQDGAFEKTTTLLENIFPEYAAFYKVKEKEQPKRSFDVPEEFKELYPQTQEASGSS